MRDVQTLMNNRQFAPTSTKTTTISANGLSFSADKIIAEYELEKDWQKYVFLRGVFSNLKSPSGIIIHALDAVTTKSFESNFTLPPSFSITVFLGGHSGVALNGTEIKYGTNIGNPLVQVQFNDENIKVDRHSVINERMRKVNISLTGGALQSWAQAGFDFGILCPTKRSKGIYFCEFIPDPEIVSAAEAIIKIGNQPTLRQQIELEKLALNILDGIINLRQEKNQSERQLIKAQQIRRYIDEHLTSNLSLSIVARDNGVSVSKLQRIFKSTFAYTAINYMRQQRLKLAYKMLLENGTSIGEIATIVGYTNVTNFSSAFRKEFGVSPSRINASGK